MIDKYNGLNYIIVHKKKSIFDVAIDRTSPWGNPFPLKNPQNLDARHVCVSNYRAWLWEQIQRGKTKMLDDLIARKNSNNGEPLKLGCWCAPRLCHGDILARACDWWESRF